MGIGAVIGETVMMMAFTFLVGMGVAYVIKILVWSFGFFTKENLAETYSDYKADFKQRRAEHRRDHDFSEALERNSEVEMLKYLYENLNSNNAEEKVNDLYSLSRYYSGMGRDPKNTKDEEEGPNALIDFYDGEV